MSRSVLVLSTTSSIDRAFIREIRDQLREFGSWEITIIGLFPPIERIRIRRCLSVGRSLRPMRRVQEVPVKTRRSRRPAKRRKPPKTLRRIRRRWRRSMAKLDALILDKAPEQLAGDNQIQFAIGTLLSRTVREEFARAELVIAHDLNTTYAAWLLAQRISGPHVVFQMSGAVRKLSELRAMTT